MTDMITENSYSIEATVLRNNGERHHTIAWEWSGKGSGTLCWNAWKRLIANGRTIDSDEPVIGALLFRNGSKVETFGLGDTRQAVPA